MNPIRSQFSLLCGLASLALGLTASANQVLLNEIYVNPPGNTLPHEFIEIKGPPLQSLDGYFLLAIPGNAGVSGRADLVLDLKGVELGANGLLVVKVSATNGFLVPPATRVVENPRLIDTAVSPLNNNTLSVLLVQSTTSPVEGTDYDSNDDGIFDVTPLDTATIVDAVAIRQLPADPVYGGVRVPNVGNDNRPEALVRLAGDLRPNNPEAWFAGRMNGSGLTVAFNAQVTPNYPEGATLTPGKDNVVFTAFRVVQSGSTTYVDEDGVLDSYTLALGAAPAAGQVTVKIAADAQVLVSLDGVQFVSETNLVFTAANALVPQLITVRAMDDALVELGRLHPGTISHSIAATDDAETFPVTLASVGLVVNIFDNESPFPIVLPSRETPASFAPDDCDDAAFWIHPADPAKSLLLTTKKLGGAVVFDPLLNEVQRLVPETNGAIRLNNVDVLYGFPLNGGKADLAVFSDRINDTLYIYRIDADAVRDPLTLISADLTTHIFPDSVVAGDTAYGLCLYTSVLTGRPYAFVSRSAKGEVAQVELYDAGGGKAGWRAVRRIQLPENIQAEGIVADQELGWVYFAQEKVGLWKYSAEPTRGNLGGTLVQKIKPAGTVLSTDIEGLCIYYGANGGGYLVVSSQGDNNFAVFSRDHANTYLGSFAIGANQALGIDQVTTCDGAEVCPIALPGYPQGVLIVQDGENDGSVSVRNTNFKLVPWETIARVFLPALDVTPTAYDPRRPTSRIQPRFDQVTRFGNGDLQIALSGALGSVHRLESSEDLSRWDLVDTLEFITPLLEPVIRVPAGVRKFYRLVAP